jgi:putative tryptophan/tyrosine transport system substrate-binding protein
LNFRLLPAIGVVERRIAINRFLRAHFVLDLSRPSDRRSRRGREPANDLIECAPGARKGDRMRRREFVGLVGGAAAWPFAAAAQAPERIVTIGYLNMTDARQWTEGHGRDFREGLRELGYVEGKNLRFELRHAEDDEARLPALASELVALNVDVIVTWSSGVFAARQATSTIPIVAAVTGDIIAAGLVSSLSHPGGNVTGSIFFVAELGAKRLQMLKEIAPSLARAGLMRFRGALRADRSHYDDVVRAAAEALKIELFVILVSGPAEFDSAFATCDEKRIEGLATADDQQFTNSAESGAIAALATVRRLPLLGPLELAENGALVGYGVDFGAMWRRAAVFVDKILKGAKPGDIPIEQPTKFKTIVNLKTATAIGIDIPPTLLAAADEVIE